MKFLVIDEDAYALISTVETLKKIGECDSSNNLLDSIYMASECDYDLIVTDICFPRNNGVNAIKELADVTQSPIIVLSLEASVTKKIEALRSGADDYIVKPCVAEELVARAEALLRRCNGRLQDCYLKDGLELDFVNKMLKINGQIVKISLRKYEILEYLIRRRNVIVSKDKLFNRIWGADQDTVISVVEVYISELRKLLKSYGKEGYIKTATGMGYMWQDK